MSTLTISVRVAGKRRGVTPDWEVPWTPSQDNSGEPLTLRELITRVVIKEVEGFRERQGQRRLARILSEREMEAGLERGRVDSGGRDLDQEVEPEAAVAVALQAFEDGLYLVILDGEEKRDLDQEVHVSADSHLVFVRLTMLAGG